LARHDDKEMTARSYAVPKSDYDWSQPCRGSSRRRAALFCSRQDPYAVRLAFRAGLEEPVEWIFARDLLSRGIQGRQGIGDGHARPSPDPRAASPAAC
jgi:hypothetical protein